MRRFVFWQDSLSIHQSALIRSLASNSGNEVTLVVWDEIDPDRRGTGWHRPDFGKTQIVIRPSSESVSELLTRDQSTSNHIFSGIRAHPMVWNAFRQGQSSNVNIGIYSEAQNWLGLKGLLRLLRNRYDSLRFRKRIDFILGTGTIAVEWFRKSGYFASRIFPFGYFVETPQFYDSYPQKTMPDKMFDLIFVGQLISRKGWDILLHALRSIKSPAWRLHVVGDGEEKDEFTKLCSTLGLSNSVRCYGNLSNSEAMRLISRSDLLVLPSRWDGWGAVVSEALMLGVPVVCSDRCGAADLLDGCERGAVFPTGSVVELRSILNERISSGKKDAVASEKIRRWSKCINGESAANYFLQIIEASSTGSFTPMPPWLR